MANEVMAAHKTNPILLKLPFFFMAMGATMGLIYIAYYMVNLIIYLDLHSYPLDSWPLLSAFYNLTLPFFVLGVALFLMWMMEARNERSSGSRALFLCGALILLIGSLIRVVNNWLIWQSSHDSSVIVNGIYSELASLSYLIGLVICALATLFVCKSYLSGDISATQKA